MRRTLNSLFLVAILVTNCKPAQKETPAQNLIRTLKSIQEKGILFGHQDDLAYGRNWKYVDGESDVKRVAGDYPALFGWELGGLELGDSMNLDAVPFNVMKRLAIKANQMGGINTFSWHPYSLVNGKNAWFTDTSVVKYIIPGGSLHEQFKGELDKLADFFSGLKTKDGHPIPFIFRPWHEMGGSWFWWGTKHTTPEEYKALFNFTINYLKQDKGLTNMVVCYSPNGGYQNEQEYLTWYPGDDVVDILGVDEYEWPGATNWHSHMQKLLSIMIRVAKEKQKLAALAETGYENVPDSLWFTQELGKAIEPDSIANDLSYVMVWRDDPVVHFFFPYQGHPAAADAKQFLEQPNIWLLNDLKNNE